MMCYKDMTFCPYYRECKKGNKCGRALTPEVLQQAKEWWDTNFPPISKYIDPPECFKEVK